ncbi:MAG: flagellar basal body P-ring formation protein FlgA, partial [Nitrospinae bacterium]|nr:flagellar basal body P-ring formation protein FlgA [Nitrospinota bacterium]
DVAVEGGQSKGKKRREVTSIDDVVGKQAIRNMGMGRVITANSLSKPVLVKKGDRVTIIVQSGSMKITAPGLVREKGFKDSLVQVLNIQTKKTVFGMVMDSKTVKVNY